MTKEELETENAELKAKKIPQLEKKVASIRGTHSVDCKKLKARTEQVERLKTENAELRNQVSAMSKALALNVPEWHDLRKDQNDLPDNSRYVWTNVGAGYYDGELWWCDFGRLQNVVAWCEPKFEEEENED